MGEQDALGQEPADRGDAEHGVDRDLRHLGNRQAERQQRAGAAQPEGRPDGRSREPEGEPRPGIPGASQAPAAPVAARQGRQVDGQQHGRDRDGAAGEGHHAAQSQDLGGEGGIALGEQDRPDRGRGKSCRRLRSIRDPHPP